MRVVRSILIFLCVPQIGVVAPIAAQEKTVRYGDWFSQVTVDAMTDSLIGKSAWVLGNPRTLTSQPVLRTYCYFFNPLAGNYIFDLEFWPGRNDGTPKGENVPVRLRVDRNVASDWWDWRARSSGLIGFLGMDNERAQKLREEMRLGSTILIRYRIPSSLEERDLEFSLIGFTRAYEATCKSN